jgi:hypothetical protein
VAGHSEQQRLQDHEADHPQENPAAYAAQKEEEEEDGSPNTGGE